MSGSYEVEVADVTVRDATFELHHPKAVAAPRLERATLIDCTVVLRGSGVKSLLSDVTFQGCRFIAKRASSYVFRASRFDGCHFAGPMRQCDLGADARLDASSRNEWPARASMTGCELREATLDDVSFPAALDARTCEWPAWPHLVVSDPSAFSTGVDPATLPPELRWLAHRDRPVAVELSKRLRLASPPEVWAVLAGTAGFLQPDLPQPDAAVVRDARDRFRRLHAIELKYRVWGILCRMVHIDDVTDAGGGEVLIHLRQAAERPLSDLPDAFVLRLADATLSLHKDGASADLGTLRRPFQITGRSVDIEKDCVGLKGARKAHGILQVTHGAWTLEDSSGTKLEGTGVHRAAS